MCDAYDARDPKHPDFYDRVVDLWDNRDKTEQMYNIRVDNPDTLKEERRESNGENDDHRV